MLSVNTWEKNMVFKWTKTTPSVAGFYWIGRLNEKGQLMDDYFNKPSITWINGDENWKSHVVFSDKKMPEPIGEKI